MTMMPWLSNCAAHVHAAAAAAAADAAADSGACVVFGGERNRQRDVVYRGETLCYIYEMLLVLLLCAR